MNNMEDMINCRGAGFEAPSPHLRFPGRLLRPDELRELQAIHTALNRLCSRLSAINEAVQERGAAIRKQSLNRDRDDSEARTEEEAIAEYLRLNGIADVNPDEIESGHHDIPGRYGLCFGDPFERINFHLTEARSRIGKLIHKESPQTTSIHRCLQSFLHLSDDGSIHGRTDTPIVQRNHR